MSGYKLIGHVAEGVANLARAAELIVGMERRAVVVVPCRPEWRVAFPEHARRIAAELGKTPFSSS